MKKHFIAVLLTFILLITLTGCGQNQTEKQPAPKSKVENISVDVGVLRGPSGISMIKMINDNPVLGEGVKVNYSIEQSTDVLSSKLLSGEIELATIPANMAATLYNKGVPYQLACMNTWGVMYVVSNGKAINSWADLKGQTIGAVSKGASSDVVFKYLLKQNGIDPDKEVTLNYSPSPVELAQLFMAGKTSLAVLPEPWVSVVQSKNPQLKIVLDLQKEWTKIQGSDTPFAQTCLVVNKEFAAQHPQVAEKFLNEYATSIDWVNKNPQLAADLVKNTDIGIPADVAAAAIPRCNLKYVSSQESKAAVNKYLQVLLQFSPETVGGKIPDDKFYYQK
ncbi:MAG TPA: ABC transporter substrate-binding protein [Syntrophomonas sp.]|nr:ABC transporter substrate-binding protein [Syntrophomonas sp.]